MIGSKKSTHNKSGSVFSDEVVDKIFGTFTFKNRNELEERAELDEPPYCAV